MPRQDDARDDRNEIKRYLLQTRDEIRGPDEQDGRHQDEQEKVHSLLSPRSSHHAQIGPADSGLAHTP